MRSGHWQCFWVGQRKGRDGVIVTVTNADEMGGGGSEVIHRARMPR